VQCLDRLLDGLVRGHGRREAGRAGDPRVGLEHPRLVHNTARPKRATLTQGGLELAKQRQASDHRAVLANRLPGVVSWKRPAAGDEAVQQRVSSDPVVDDPDRHALVGLDGQVLQRGGQPV
jgi:hypothetical protein